MVAENIHISINFQKLGKARYGLGVNIDIILTVQYWQFITEMHNKCTVSQESVFSEHFIIFWQNIVIEQKVRAHRRIQKMYRYPKFPILLSSSGSSFDLVYLEKFGLN